MSLEHMNGLTVEEAAERLCPMRPGEKCVATGCMAWRWKWGHTDGFEEFIATSLDWREDIGEDPDGLKVWLEVTLGDPARAAELAGRYAETDPEDYDAADELADEIDAALEPVLTAKLEEWAAANRPEGEGWGCEPDNRYVADGKMTARYQRPAKKRGCCGLAGGGH